MDRVGSFSAPSQAASSRQSAEARFCASLTRMPGPLRPLPAHAGSLAAASATSPGGDWVPHAAYSDAWAPGSPAGGCRLHDGLECAPRFLGRGGEA